jgi:chloramphenicol O-acetyltransferase type A
MRQIDFESWPRREHYKLYNSFDYPHFNMCANVDITEFHRAVKQRGVSFTLVTMYLTAYIANEIPEFRFRIRGDKVIEHDLVHPAITYMTEGELFNFLTVPFKKDLSQFLELAAEQIAYLQTQKTLAVEVGRDDLLYMTSIPWVSFTSFMHPIHLSPIDSLPRFAWGKFYPEGERLLMPLSVQAHHALLDGLHMGRYYELIQAYLHDPSDYLV